MTNMIRATLLALTGVAAVTCAAPAYADGYDDSLDLSGAANTYIESPTGNFDSYSGYVTTMDDLYLKPLGDTQTPSLALADMPSGSYNYGTSVQQGAQDVENQVLADFHAGELSAAHPDVILGYSYSTVADAEAEQVLYNTDGVPSADLAFVDVGDTSNPIIGYIQNFMDNPANAWLIDLLGFQSLEGLITPTNLYPTDIVTINGDGYADTVANNPWGNDLHELYPGLDAALINSATETSVGMTHSFTIDLSTTDIFTYGLDALMNVFGAV